MFLNPFPFAKRAFLWFAHSCMLFVRFVAYIEESGDYCHIHCSYGDAILLYIYVIISWHIRKCIVLLGHMLFHYLNIYEPSILFYQFRKTNRAVLHAFKCTRDMTIQHVRLIFIFFFRLSFLVFFVCLFLLFSCFVVFQVFPITNLSYKFYPELITSWRTICLIS